MTARAVRAIARRRAVPLLGVLLAPWVWGCGGSAPKDDASAPAAAPPDAVRQVDLLPGTPVAPTPRVNPFADDAHARAEGRRLYDWMNCSGCHFAGGGGIGPPLMDDDWIYGGRPDQIFDSIASGRANGMPAYGDKLAAGQIWRIVAHVESLGEGVGPPGEVEGREETRDDGR